MIFNETIRKKYFVLDKQTIIDKYENRLKYVSEVKVTPKEDEVVYYDYKLLMFPFLQENGTLREATDRELIEKGICSLAENQVLVGEEAKYTYEFPMSPDLVKPIFDKNTLQWVESATPEEIVEHEENKKVEFYNSELNLATKAFTEYDLGLATEQDIQEVKSYMCSINPYRNGVMLFRVSTPQRPSIFDRYK